MARNRLRDFGEQLDEVCEARGIYKRDIAKVLDVSNSYMSQVVKRGGTPEQIEQITQALVELNVRIDGQPIRPTYFDTYNGKRIFDEAEHGDEVAITLIRAYSKYNNAGLKEQREIRKAIAELQTLMD